MTGIKKTKFHGIYKIDGKLATVNLTPGEKVYGEELVKVKGVEYRIWDFWRSKPAAAIKKGLKVFPIEKGMHILYLGIASGTTSSHFSDIVGREGLIWGVEISERVLRDLIPHAEKRGNIICILNDARRPELYKNFILGEVDIVYEDIADPDQIKILIRNCETFLKPAGYAIIAIKSQSIDVLKSPREVYRGCIKELANYFDILDKVELDPYEKHHLFLVMKRKNRG